MERAKMADSKSLMSLIEILEPLSAEERRRNINAALTYFGDAGLQPAINGVEQPPRECGGDGAHFAPAIAARMKQNGISVDHALHAFEFREGEPFRILAVPGKEKKSQMLAMYHLVGLGTYLESGKRDFVDATARQYCKDYGCYDQTNHAKYMDDKHPAFTGDKSSGWMLTVPGIKVAAAIVKEVAEAAEAP
jgi:hypothetical protein